MRDFVPLVAGLAFAVWSVLGRALFHYLKFGSSGIAVFKSSERRKEDIAASLSTPLIYSLNGLLVLLAPGLAARICLVPAALFPTVRMLGEVVLAVAVLFNLVPQLQMGASWRFGIEEASRPGLVQTGIFRFSRNPIYVALILANLGVQLLYPTPLSVILLVGQFAGLRGAVKGEEEYLRKAYGDEYVQYAQRVGRFLPGMGLLK